MGLEPRLGVRERAPAQTEPVCPALDAPGDHAGILEDAEMLRDRGLRHAKPLGRLPDGRGPRREPLDDRASDGMREREEAAIELCLIVHLKVNYNDRANDSAVRGV